MFLSTTLARPIETLVRPIEMAPLNYLGRNRPDQIIDHLKSKSRRLVPCPCCLGILAKRHFLHAVASCAGQPSQPCRPRDAAVSRLPLTSRGTTNTSAPAQLALMTLPQRRLFSKPRSDSCFWNIFQFYLLPQNSVPPLAKPVLRRVFSANRRRPAQSGVGWQPPTRVVAAQTRLSRGHATNRLAGRPPFLPLPAGGAPLLILRLRVLGSDLPTKPRRLPVGLRWAASCGGQRVKCLRNFQRQSLGNPSCVVPRLVLEVSPAREEHG
jgi:hypothetical protein